MGVGKFMQFICERNLSFSAYEELDDLLVEYKHSQLPTKSEFEAAVAGVEYAIPQAKARLPWSHAVLAAWNVVHQPKHTIPMTEGPAVFIGCHMAAKRHARLGAGVIVQEALGLRPSELLGLEHEDVMLPEDRAEQLWMPTVLSLGTKHGTKAKRAQTVQLAAPKKVALIRWLKSGTRPGERLIGYTYENYRRVLSQTCEQQGLQDLGFTPHSPRSGFASDCVAAGLGFSRTRELGRWVSESSLRTYVDITSAAAIQVSFKLQHLNEAVAYCCANMLQFFVGSEAFLYVPPSSQALRPFASTDAASGIQEAAGRELCTPAVYSLVDGTKSVQVHEEDRHASEREPSGSEERACRGRGRGFIGRRPQTDEQVPQEARGRAGRRGRAAARATSSASTF